MAITHYSYSDIFLKPRYSDYDSRSDVNTEILLGPALFKIPVVPANMACTIDAKLAKWMSENGYFYIMHRFNKNRNDAPNHDNLEFVKIANIEQWHNISISVGVQNYDKEFLKTCADNNWVIDYITIDIAMGHSHHMKEMIQFIKELKFKPHHIFPGRDKPTIIAGNVATPEAVIDLENWGADVIKVGIAGGSVCSTFGQTGFGVPMFTCIQECAMAAKNPIIADGGIRTNGDFAKAIVAGATMVMAGSVFAACKDSPAETVTKFIRSNEVERQQETIAEIIIPGVFTGAYKDQIVTKLVKKFYGSASEYNKGTKHHIEGTLAEIPCNGMTYAEKLLEIEECIQSSISYAGGNLGKVEWGVHK